MLFAVTISTGRIKYHIAFPEFGKVQALVKAWFFMVRQLRKIHITLPPGSTYERGGLYKIALIWDALKMRRLIFEHFCTFPVSTNVYLCNFLKKI